MSYVDEISIEDKSLHTCYSVTCSVDTGTHVSTVFSIMVLITVWI